MKVLLVNGSPHEKGCVYTALSEIVGELEKNGIETEIFQLGTEPVRGCIACRGCFSRGDGHCVFDDAVNAAADKIREADALIVGTPVYFAGIAGQVKSFMDRLFYSAEGPMLRGKPAAAVMSCRRGGASSTFDQMNHYFTIREMPVVSSRYWNAVHGNTPDEVRQDIEGLQIMRTLARNMAWMLKNKEAGIVAGIELPEQEPRVATNFIR